jgi:hypothetical protein
MSVRSMFVRFMSTPLYVCATSVQIFIKAVRPRVYAVRACVFYSVSPPVTSTLFIGGLLNHSRVHTGVHISLNFLNTLNS